MNIISRKTSKNDSNDFITKAYNDPNISGITLDITMTSDEKIVIFEGPASFVAEVESIQKQTLEQIKDSETMLLETYLTKLKGFNKRIMLNIFPLELPYLSDETVQYIVNRTNNYIDKLLEVIDKYPQLNIVLFTYNQILITLLKNRNTKYKIGWLINQTGSSYIDLDIYIFQTYLLNQAVLLQQIDEKKEIMAYITDSDSINSFMNFFKDKNNDLKKARIFEDISVITYYPDIFINSYKLVPNLDK